MSASSLPPDTQAALLLCGQFTATSAVKPLSLAEYNAVAVWLRDRQKRPADLLHPDELPSGEGLPEADRLRALLARGVQMAIAVERWQRLGLWVVGRSEERYPRRLRRVLPRHAPPVLFGAGDIARLDAGGLAIVGSRVVTDENLAFTRRVAERAVRDGQAVISGGAPGVDKAALEAALNAGGHVIGVLSDRLDKAATARDTKPYLRDGRLTLVSPYEPEAGFTVSRAMARNKHIYALADQALVVRFTTEEGGTWAGAVERLKANGDGVAVPVFVHVEGNPADGWERLRQLGALPFPAEAFERDGVEALRTPAQPEIRPIEPPAVSSPTTCYEACLPLILPHLRGEPGAKQLPAIARALVVTTKQLEEWLKLGVKDGRVVRKKKGRGMVYALPSPKESSPGLFSGDDAA